MVIRPPPRIQLPEQHIIFGGESTSPGGVMHGPFSVLWSPRQATIPGLAISRAPLRLPDPLLPKGRDRMVSTQVLEGNSNQTFVVVGPQGVAAVAQEGTQYDPHPSSSFPCQKSIFTRESWKAMYIMIQSSGLPETRIW